LMTNSGDRDATGEPLSVMVVQLPHARDMPLPFYQSASAAGIDLTAAVQAGEPLTLKPGERALVPTGLVLQIPEGHEGQVRPRSGIALRHGVTVLNSPGTIDADYRGEVMVLLINLGDEPVNIKRGERIAQLVFAPITQASLIAVKSVSDTSRGSGGFGSTGM
jgi:dUTP pyrophosphatase